MFFVEGEELLSFTLKSTKVRSTGCPEDAVFGAWSDLEPQPILGFAEASGEASESSRPSLVLPGQRITTDTQGTGGHPEWRRSTAGDTLLFPNKETAVYQRMLLGEKRTPTCQVSLNKAAWNAVASHTYTSISNSFLGSPSPLPGRALVYSVLFSSHQAPLTQDRYTVLLRGSKQSHKPKRTAWEQSCQWEVAPKCHLWVITEIIQNNRCACASARALPGGPHPPTPLGTEELPSVKIRERERKKGDSTESGFHRPPALEGNGKAAQIGCQFLKTEDVA